MIGSIIYRVRGSDELDRVLPWLTRMSIGVAGIAAAGAVALCAHSQGSVIAAAAVLQLDPVSRQRTVLLTFGSPLRRFYGRYFPAYFGDDTLRSVERATGSRWINLWAPSDPIGGPALDATVDRTLTDPTSLQPNPDDTYPPICGHSGYLARTEYRESLADLLLPNLTVRVRPSASSLARGIGADSDEAVKSLRRNDSTESSRMFSHSSGSGGATVPVNVEA